MNYTINKITRLSSTIPTIIIANNKSNLSAFNLNKKDLSYIKSKIQQKDKQVIILNPEKQYFIHFIDPKKEKYIQHEKARVAGNEFGKAITKEKLKQVQIADLLNNPDHTKSVVEGLTLGTYQFLKYFKDKKKKENALQKININCNKIQKKDIDKLTILLEAVYLTRDLVNEPVSFMNAPQLAKEIIKLGKEASFKVEVFDKKKIESLKMGGLLAVNKGSIDPPRFSILEWKPQNAKNKKPIVFVGKGIVYDTGGLSLKPTPDSMELMKSDMAGAAVVIGLFYAIAKTKLPVHVIGLIPSTDNRPDGNAYAPGDVIKMYDGTHVEVLNTDAEGRMILADALSYANKYKPELVIDIATLTGAAQFAIGHYATVAMGTAKDSAFKKLAKSGESSYERIVKFPFFEEYGELIKSNIADLKNIGGKVAGAITAGKFLEHFTSYPWIHLDIAGPAFLTSEDKYLKKGGTGIGVRLLYDFLKTNY